jgi:hypothetical protein
MNAVSLDYLSISLYNPTSGRTRFGSSHSQLTNQKVHQIFQQRCGGLKMIGCTERKEFCGLVMVAAHARLFKAYSRSFTSLIVVGINMLARNI